jgi:hypothetical protein
MLIRFLKKEDLFCGLNYGTLVSFVLSFNYSAVVYVGCPPLALIGRSSSVKHLKVPFVKKWLES